MESVSSANKFSVFISYAREDKEFAEQLKTILSNHGINVWLDETELRPLEKWGQEIKNAILSHDYVIFIASRSSTSPESFCKQELSFAKQNHKIIIPINIDPQLNWLPDEINEINWINFSSIASIKNDNKISLHIESDEFTRSFNLLLTTLETDLDWVKTFTKLLQKSWEWDENKKNESYLLVGDELEYFQDAVDKYHDTKPSLVPLQSELLSASKEYQAIQLEKQKRNKKRLRILLISLSILFVLGGISAIINWRQNTVSKASELAKLSQLSTNEADTSLLLSLEAFQLSKTPDVQSALYSTIANNNYLSKIFKVGQLSNIATGNDKLIMTYCIERGKTYCQESELRLIDLNTYTDFIPPIQIQGELYFPIINGSEDKIAVETIVDGNDEKVIIYNIQKGNSQLLQTIIVNPFSMIFGVQDDELIVGTSAGEIEFWNTDSGIKSRGNILVREGSNVTGLVINKENNCLYSTDKYGILMWDLSNSKPEPKAFSGFSHVYGILGIDTEGKSAINDSFIDLIGSDDGQWLVTKGIDGTIIWDTTKQESINYAIKKINLQIKDVNQMAFYPNSPILLFISDANKISLYNVDSQTTISIQEKKDIYDVKITSNGRYIILSTTNGDITVYDTWLSNRFIENTIQIKPNIYLTDLDVQNNNILIGEIGSFHLFKLNQTNSILEFKQESGVKYALAPDGQTVAIGYEDGSVKILNPITDDVGQKIQTQNKGKIVKLLFSPDSESLYALYYDGLILKINCRSGEIQWKLDYPIISPGQLSFAKISPDGKYLAFTTMYINDKTIDLVNTEGETPKIVTLHEIMDDIGYGSTIWSVGFSPDSRYIALSTTTNIFIYDLKIGEVSQIIIRKDQGMIYDMEYLDSDHLILTFTSGDLLNSDNLYLKKFKEQRLELYEISQSALIGVINNPDDNLIFKIKNIGEGNFITASLNGDVKFWNISDEQIRKVACSIANRELTAAEWEKYIGKIRMQKPQCNEGVNQITPLKDKNITPSKLATILGNNLGGVIDFSKKIELEETPESSTSVRFDIQNNVDGLTFKNPAIIQCRDNTKRTELVNQYMFYWPLSIESTVDTHIWKTDVSSSWEYPDGTSTEIKMVPVLPPGIHQIIVPDDNIQGLVINGPEKENGSLQLKTNAIDEGTVTNNLLKDILVTNVVGNAHTNAQISDVNHPMHSLQLQIKDLSNYNINTVILLGIVYNNNNEAIDLLEYYYSSDDTPIINSGDSKLIVAKSLSQTGRCVGLSDMTSPFNINYYIGFVFATDNKEYPYGTIFGEYKSN